MDTTFTDANGFYAFCNVSDTIVFVKAAPDSASFPTEMPTYADSSLVWNQATPYSTLTLPYLVNFSTIFGQNPGGSGFIGGLISQGANKTSGPGDPVPGLGLFLVDDGSGAILDHTESDVNGYFSFANIPFGSYRIVPDQPGVDEQNVPVVSVSSSTPARDSLNFLLHSTYLEWVIPAFSDLRTDREISLVAGSNPFSGEAVLKLDLPFPEEIRLRVFDMRGRELINLCEGKLKAGQHEFKFQPEASGLYFVRMESPGQVRSLKLLKQE